MRVHNILFTFLEINDKINLYCENFCENIIKIDVRRQFHDFKPDTSKYNRRFKGDYKD